MIVSNCLYIDVASLVPVILSPTSPAAFTSVTAVTTIDYEKLGYQTGEMAIRVLKGEEPKNMPVETLKNTQLIVNKKAAEKYGIDLGALEGAKLY